VSSELSRISPARRSGDEPLHSNGDSLGITLLDFWRWSSSDLVSNATRGVLAEFIVAHALGIALDGVRNEWDAFDLITYEGITVEVKSAAFIQSWAQRSLSTIVFRVPKTRAWSADTNVQAKESRRQAQIYVFALLAQKDIYAEAVDLSDGRIECPCGVAFYVAIMSALQNRRVQGATVVMGDLTIQGNIKGLLSLAEPLTIAMDNGALRAVVPLANKAQFAGLPEVVEKVDLVFYGDVERAVMKALEG
jgi:hypothetical protein